LKLKTAVSNSQSDEEEEEEEGEEEDQEEDEEEEDGDSDKNDSDLDADLTDSDESRNSQGGSVTTLNTFRPSRLPPVKERRASISGALTTEAAGERKSAMGVPAAKARRASLSGALSTETIQQTRNAPVRERRGSIIGASVTEHGGDRKPTMCGPPARERRGSISGAVTAEAVEEVQEKMRDVPVIGAEWMARLLSSEDVRSHQRDCLWHVVSIFEDSIPSTAARKALDTARLVEKASSEVDAVMRTMAKHAMDLVRADIEELQTLRAEHAEFQDKLVNLNQTYLKEVSANRNRNRKPIELTEGTKDMLNTQSVVEFYEPLQYVSKEMRSLVLTILDDKIRAIFARDPNVRELCNQLELARVEDAIMRDKLAELTKTNTKLREENNDLNKRLKQAHTKIQRQSWELGETQQKIWRLQQETESRDAWVQVTLIGDGVVSVEATNDVGVQATPCSSRKGSHMHSRCTTGMMEEALAMLVDGTCADNSEDDLSTNQRAEKTAAQGEAQVLQSDRDNPVKQLASVREELAAMRRDAAASQIEAVASAERVQAAESDAGNAKKQVVMLKREQSRLQHELDKANDSLQGMERRIQSLKQDAENAHVLAAQMERRRMEMVEACSKGLFSQELAADLETETKQRKVLEADVEDLKSALSTALSRNAALELALEANGGSSPAKPAPSTRSLESHPNVEQQKHMREKVEIKRAQLQQVLNENSVLHLALQELQQDLQNMTKQLRTAMPSADDIVSPDLESVMIKMEKAVRQGAGAYLRLHKDAHLRSIALETRRSMKGDPDAVLAESDHEDEVVGHRPSSKSEGRPEVRSDGRSDGRYDIGGQFETLNAASQPCSPSRPISKWSAVRNSVQCIAKPARNSNAVEADALDNAAAHAFSRKVTTMPNLITPATPRAASKQNKESRNSLQTPLVTRQPLEQRGNLILGRGGMALMGVRPKG